MVVARAQQTSLETQALNTSVCRDLHIVHVTCLALLLLHFAAIDDEQHSHLPA